MAGESRSVLVAGVGMIPFGKPGKSRPYDEMGTAAVRLALADAGIDFALIEQAYAGFVYGDTSSGQKVIYKAGLTGIPIVNVNNACASGSTALFLARQAVETGAAECALAVGFEQMVPGALNLVFSDRPRRRWRARSRSRPNIIAVPASSIWRCTAPPLPISPRSAPRPAAMRRKTRCRCFETC